MDVPLLTAKLYIPPVRPEVVPRAGLIERLNAGLYRRLTLLSAPAGYGKTTLLGQWVAQCARPVAWLSLDEGDNDPVRFWAYVAGALRTVRPEIGDIAQVVFQSSQPPPVESALAGLLNQIAEAPDPFVLVLDDYHMIRTPAIHEGIAFLLENLSPQMHLVIATRADPPLGLPRLRGRDQLTELYQSDLRFTLEEAATFLNEVMGLRLSGEDVAALEGRTEGWIAGLQMAAVSMQRRDDVAGFIQAFTGTHRYILDYLVEEVLQQQPPGVRRFLLQTSILDRLCSALCDAVIGTGQPVDGQPAVDSQAVLEHLERNNLFVVPLDDRRQWYRYHHLFADLLRQRLRREHRDWEPELHRRAGEWYEQNGMVAEAVGHALTAGDLERAAHLIEQTGWATFTRGEMTTIRGWIAALPDDFVRSRPQLGVLHAWAMAKSGRLEDVESCLEGINSDLLRGEVAAVRAYVAGVRGDLPRAVTLAQQALEQLPEEDLFLRAIVTQNLGVAYHWSGDSAAAVRTLTRAVELGRAAGQAFQTLTSMAILGRAYEMQGSLRQATETYREALALASEKGSRPVPFAGMAYVGLAGTLYEWNDLDDAVRCAMEGIRLSALGGFVAYHVFGHALLARAYEAKGDRARALEMLQKAEQLGQGGRYVLVMALVAELRARLWVAQGNVAAALQWAEERRWRTDDPLDAAREIELTAVAWVISTHGRPGEALSLLARLLEAAQAAGRTGSAIKILALQGLAFQAQDRAGEALSALERALALAEPEGYVRTFLDEGEPMKDLLSQILLAQQKERQASSRGISPNYVARLLAAFGEEAELSSLATESLIEPLTEREMDVLRLVIAGLSNAEIAEELVIAVSTVKSHVNHIYGKLGVENRTQAVIRAQELALI
jgi:LuxR family maltose regulon positive regulatory protein